MKMLKQVLLTQGKRSTITWIDSKKAIAGKRVNIRESSQDEWSGPWTISEVWGVRPGEFIDKTRSSQKNRAETVR